MTEAEHHAAALADPDGQPLTPEDFKRMKRVPRVTIIRRAFRLSREEFAAQFHIPIDTIRDWEQGVSEPDDVAMAYSWIIASEPTTVRELCFISRPSEPIARLVLGLANVQARLHALVPARA